MMAAGASTTSATAGAVLFACNFNRVRSPMAEALLKRMAADRIYVESCGLWLPDDDADAEAARTDPFVDVVLAEIGCGLRGHRPKTFADLEDESFDLIVSFTPEAHERAAEFVRGRAVALEYWPIADPTLAEGNRETRLEAYRQARDALATRIADRFG